jgi:hypothetical protein
VTCRSSVCQAACECSLIRPPRTGFRRACCVSMPVTVARGPSGSSSGTRCAMPWCGRAVLCAPGSRSGRRANVARRGSARGPGVHGASPRGVPLVALVDDPSGRPCRGHRTARNGRAHMTDSWRDRPPPGRAGGDDDVEVNVLKAFHFGEQRDVGLAAADHIPQRRADGSEQRSQIRGFIGSRVIERDGMTARDKHQPAGQRRAGCVATRHRGPR